MAEIAVRVLDESEWSLYRDVVTCPGESPDAFTATLADEADRDDQLWRDRMTRSDRPAAAQSRWELSASDPTSRTRQRPRSSDCTSSQMHGVLASLRRPRRGCGGVGEPEGLPQLYYWVGTDNARAIGFAKNFGFRTTSYRRPARGTDLQRGDEEIAMMLSLEPDASSSPNPTSRRAATGEGPLSRGPTWLTPGALADQTVTGRSGRLLKSVSAALIVNAVVNGRAQLLQRICKRGLP